MSLSSFDEGAAARSAVAGTDAAGDAARGVLASVLVETAKTDDREAVRAAALEHLDNLAPTMQGDVALAAAGETPPDAASEAVRERVIPRTPATHETEQPPEEEPAPVAGYDLDPDIPEDIAAWLATADEDVDVQAQVDAELRAMPDLDDDEDGIVDLDDDEPVGQTERIRQEVASRIKAERRAAALEERLAEQSRGKWADEVKGRKLLLTDDQLSGITATSRRGFWREAMKLHETNTVLARELIGPATDTRDQEDAERVAARREYEQAWGRPVPHSAGAAPTDAQDAAARIAAQRRGQTFHERVRSMLRGE